MRSMMELHDGNQNDVHDEIRRRIGECVLLFSSISSVFPFHIKKLKD
jgi:hypothetical protein